MGLQSPTRDTTLQGAWHILPLSLGVRSSGPQSWALGGLAPQHRQQPGPARGSGSTQPVPPPSGRPSLTLPDCEAGSRNAEQRGLDWDVAMVTMGAAGPPSFRWPRACTQRVSSSCLSPSRINTQPQINTQRPLTLGFPGGTRFKESTCQGRRHKRYRFDPWVRRIPWRRKWQPLLWTEEPDGKQSMGSQTQTRLK